MARGGVCDLRDGLNGLCVHLLRKFSEWRTMPSAPAVQIALTITTKIDASATNSVPVVPSLCAFKDVADRLGVPLTTACRRDTSGVQRSRNLPQRGCTSLLRLTDDRRTLAANLSASAVTASTALLRACGALGYQGSPREPLQPRGPAGSVSRLARAPFGQRGEQVQDERVNVRPKLGDQEGHLVSHEAADEMYVTAEAIQLRHCNVTPELPRGG